VNADSTLGVPIVLDVLLMVTSAASGRLQISENRRQRAVP
jgi:hypothetical protein